jgi:hypothetical protein
MSYSLFIEGTQGGRRVRHGILPRRGDWLSVEFRRGQWWLPVLEVCHMLSGEEVLPEGEDGCDYRYTSADCLVLTSLALGVRATPRNKDESFKVVLPPSRWPLGGQSENGEGDEGRGNQDRNSEDDLR